jgi:hypothetical protein
VAQLVDLRHLLTDDVLAPLDVLLCILWLGVHAQVKQLVDWVMGDRDALVCLQSIYNDAGADKGTRIKAASAAIGYERPKLTFGVQISGPAVLGERLDQNRTMKTVNPPLIEHQPQ